MRVGGDSPNDFPFDFQKDAVEEVADRLGRHGKDRQLKKMMQRGGRQSELNLPFPVRQGRKVFRGEVLKGVAGTAAHEADLLVRHVDRNGGLRRESVEDARELFGRHRKRFVDAGNAAERRRADLNVKVGRDERDLFVGHLNQHVADDGKRLTAFDDAFDTLKRREQRFAGALNELHGYFPENSVRTVR